MSKLRIAALVASVTMAIPVFAQTETTTTTTTTVQTSPMMSQDQAKAYVTAADMLNDPNVHWTVKEQTALLVQAPYVRSSDMWELSHMFKTMPANDQRVIFAALTNTIKANAGDYYARRAAERTYWFNKYNSPLAVTTTVTTTPPAITTPSTSYTPSTAVETTTVTTRPQTMTGSVFTGMSVVSAWELMQKDLDAADRTRFRVMWNDMTSSQQDALINIARGSHYYFVTRSAGVYYNPF